MQSQDFTYNRVLSKKHEFYKSILILISKISMVEFRLPSKCYMLAKLFMILYTIFKQIIHLMNQNQYIPNFFELLTHTSLYSAIIPTFVYPPTQNPQTSLDFHYNCNLQLQHFPYFLEYKTLPSLEDNTKQLQNRNQPLQKIKNPRKRNDKKEIESAKKNGESNLVNQLYSYFNSYEKSQKIVQKALNRLNISQNQMEKAKSIFYNIVRLINFKRGRKYINKQSILAYYSPKSCVSNLTDIVEQLQTINLITIQQFCYIFRVCTYHFFKEISIPALLTSKRIGSLARNEHLKRRRRVVGSLKAKNLE